MNGWPHNPPTKLEALALTSSLTPAEGTSVWQWMADQINVLFLDRGLTGKPGSIAPATCRDIVLNGKGF